MCFHLNYSVVCFKCKIGCFNDIARCFICLAELFRVFCLKASGRVFYFKNSRQTIFKDPAGCLDFETTSRVFDCCCWNLVMNLFCVICDGSCIFMFYIIWKCIWFFDMLWNEDILVFFTATNCYQLACEGGHLVRQAWNLA